MSLKKRLIFFLVIAGIIMSILMYISHNISDIPTFHRFADKIFSDHYTSVMFFSFLSVSIIGLMVYVFINKYINRRLKVVSQTMKQIEGLKDLSLRIEPDGNKDEISTLILNLNDTLDKLEKERISKEELENMLVTSEKLVSIGRLSASIAHEINNPILAISNCFQAIKKVCVDNPDLNQKAIAISEKEIARIRVIVSNLLDFHRMEKEDFTEVNLSCVILESLEVLKWGRKLGATRITTELEQECLILGSQGKLKQVFINFILNSIEASGHKQGELRIALSSSCDGKYCEVHIVDNGPGISPGIKKKLFEPFVSTKEDKGVGLGLYVSYKIIKNHHGEILYDDAYEKGAYFKIRLPVYGRKE